MSRWGMLLLLTCAATPGKVRVYIDPGHGAKGNPGNDNCFCEEEQAVMLDLAMDLRTRLLATGRYEVLLAREPGETVDYWARVDEAQAWGAAVFLSLHSDARGVSQPGRCPTNPDQPGFALLWSDEGALASDRLALARSLATAMASEGMTPYDGREYGVYGADTVPGVFVDRHAPDQRILVLRRPLMPSVIIETHHAWNPVEAASWRTEETRAAFARAVDHALRGG